MSASPSNYRRLKALLPSGAISISIHCILVVVAGVSLRGCEQGVPVQAGGAEFHEIGLAVISDSADNNTATPAVNPSDSDVEQPAEADAEDLTKVDDIPTEAPSLDQLLNPSTSPSSADTQIPKPLDLENILGSGRPLSASNDSSASSKQQPKSPAGTSGQTTAGSPTPGPGETAFMDIIGAGDSFVYLIDVSSSMMENQNRRLNLAKSQLVNSLRSLQRNQSFQVFFYSDYTESLKLGRRTQDLYEANTVNLELAERFISSVRAHGGTSHRLALERALELKPDVVYFLTDGKHPGLTPSEVKQMERMNQKGTQIHVVEFASGPLESRGSTWLHQLAQQSGGKYRRIQVK